MRKIPQQVFNVDETGLFWKMMPRRTYITKNENALPGHKIQNDRLTLLLGANASGDFKFKPMLVYHSENPRVIRGELGVNWKSNHKAWVTRQLFYERASEVFSLSVEKYLTKKKMEVKALLLLDNAPGHDPKLASSLIAKFPFIKVKFLPSNTSLIEPMNQQVTANFKTLYTKKVFHKCFETTSCDERLTLKEFWKTQFGILEAVRIIVLAWLEVSVHCLNAAWRPIWPAIQQH
jgi:hypothetical protein